MSTIENKVIEIIRKMTEDMGIENITPQTKIFDELDFDSLDIMFFIEKLESEFDIRFTDIANLVDSITDVKSVSEYISEEKMSLDKY